MSESGSLRRALSLVRDELSPSADDKARLRARIVLPALLAGASTADAAAAQPVAPDAAGLERTAAPQSTVLESAPVSRAGPAPTSAAPGAVLARWSAMKAAGSVGLAAGLALLGVGGGIGFWLGHSAGVESARGATLAAARSNDAASAPSAPAPERQTAALAAPAPEASPGAASGGLPSASAAASTPPSAIEPPGALTTRSGDRAGASEASRAALSQRARPARRRAGPNPLNDELALLRRVERALRNNDPALARAVLGELDERFPDSRLAEERSAARRIADCRSDEPGARDEARAFLRQHGASVYRQRIALACALDDEPRAKRAPANIGAAAVTNAESADTHAR